MTQPGNVNPDDGVQADPDSATKFARAQAELQAFHDAVWRQALEQRCLQLAVELADTRDQPEDG